MYDRSKRNAHRLTYRRVRVISLSTIANEDAGGPACTSLVNATATLNCNHGDSRFCGTLLVRFDRLHCCPW